MMSTTATPPKMVAVRMKLVMRLLLDCSFTRAYEVPVARRLADGLRTFCQQPRISSAETYLDAQRAHERLVGLVRVVSIVRRILNVLRVAAAGRLLVQQRALLMVVALLGQLLLNEVVQLAGHTGNALGLAALTHPSA